MFNRFPVLIKNLPMPPSVNSSYATVVIQGKFRRIKSRDLKQFKISMAERMAETDMLGIENLKSVIDNGYGLSIKRMFFFNRDRVFRKDGKPKKLDVTNRIKHLDDALCDWLGIDDKYIFYGSEIKAVSINGEESVWVSLNPLQEKHFSASQSETGRR